MARSVDEIYNKILQQKDARQELDGLDSSSKTAIYKAWAYITACVLFSVETMFDVLVSQIKSIFRKQKPGTLLWYRSMCMDFRYGVAISEDNIQREEDVPKLISQCSVRETKQGLIIKVAKGESELRKLDFQELNAFNIYLRNKKYAGTRIRIINANANLLHVSTTIYYDPLVLKSDGTKIIGGTRPVDEAINEFLRNLPFDGRLKILDITNAIQKAEGVKDIAPLAVRHKYEDYGYEDITVSAIPYSGYFKIAPEHQLINTITYVPYV